MGRQRVFRFIVIGGLSFFVDYFVFYFLYPHAGIFARLMSFFSAVLFSWLLNRRFTFVFKEKNVFFEFLKYLSSSKVSYAANLGLFYVLFSILGIKALFSYAGATFFSAFLSYSLYRRI